MLTPMQAQAYLTEHNLETAVLENVTYTQDADFCDLPFVVAEQNGVQYAPSGDSGTAVTAAAVWVAI